MKWSGGARFFVAVMVLIAGGAHAQDGNPRNGLKFSTSDTAPKNRVVSDTFFVGQDGVVTLTNRPSQYRGDSSYTEIKIEYKPIIVSGRYRFASASGEYSREDIHRLVAEYARQYELDENLVLAVIHVESSFDQFAVSKRGAQGLMQIMPDTARQMQVRNSFDAAQNIAAGTQYLAKMLEVFESDQTKAIAAYNAGPDAVKRHKGVPPYKETQRYVAKVQKRVKEIVRERDALKTEPSTTKQSPAP